MQPLCFQSLRSSLASAAVFVSALLGSAAGAEQQTFLVKRVELLPTSEGAEVRISGEGSLVWSRVRVVDGIVAVVVPDADLPEGLGVVGEHELVEEIEVAASPKGKRRAVMVAVRPTQRVEHVLDIEGGQLVLRLKPLVRSTPARSPAEAPSSALSDLTGAELLRLDESIGTAARPFLGPAPNGAAATELLEVARRELEGRSGVFLRADAELSYSCFFLPEPDRFVVDLHGVLDRTVRSDVTGEEDPLVQQVPLVHQVRVGQFQRRPDPVTRVVFDLAERGRVRTLRTEEGLYLFFD